MKPHNYAFGSPVYPGLAKLAEECGEVIQVIGKLMMTGGSSDHWDGTNLRKRLIEEMSDLKAAIEFVATFNFDHVECTLHLKRADDKNDLFEKWHNE